MNKLLVALFILCALFVLFSLLPELLAFIGFLFVCWLLFGLPAVVMEHQRVKREG